MIVVTRGPSKGLNIKYYLHHEYHVHVGITKIWKRMQVNFWWLKMLGSTKSHILSCEICQWSKDPTLKASGML